MKEVCYTMNMKTCRRSHIWGPPNTRCPECVKLKDQKYNAQNREKLNSYKKQWYKENKEERNKKSKQYYQANKEKILEQTKAYSKKNTDKTRARRHGLTVTQVNEMLERQKGKCAICSIVLQKSHIDHDHKCCPGKNSCGKCVRGILCVSCNVKLGWFEGREEAISKYRNV